MISDENKALNKKLYDKTDNLNKLKRAYDIEKMIQVMKERKKSKTFCYLY